MKDPSTRWAHLSIVVSFYSFALVGLSVGVGGVILKSLSVSYRVGDAVLGTLFFALYLSYSVSSFFCGPLAQRLSLYWLLVVGTALFLLSMVGFILEVSLALLEISYVCLGLGTGIIETGFNIFLSALPQSTSLLNYSHAFFAVGTIVGPLLATGILALDWGWNMIYVVLAILILLQLGGIALFLSAPVVEKDRSGEQAPVFRETLTQPLIWLLSIFLLVYSGVEICASSWGYTYLIETQAFGPLVAGWIVAGFGIGLTLGRFLIQPLAQRKGIGVTTLMYMLIGADDVADAIWYSGWYWLLSPRPELSSHVSTNRRSCSQTPARAPRPQRNRGVGECEYQRPRCLALDCWGSSSVSGHLDASAIFTFPRPHSACLLELSGAASERI